jgi:hypothetical protein
MPGIKTCPHLGALVLDLFVHVFTGNSLFGDIECTSSPLLMYLGGPAGRLAASFKAAVTAAGGSNVGAFLILLVCTCVLHRCYLLLLRLRHSGGLNVRIMGGGECKGLMIGG